MVMYTVDGIVTEPDKVTPWRGYYYIGIAGGIAKDGDGTWRTGENRVPTDPSTGYATKDFPGGTTYYFRFESFRGDIKGPYYFELTGDTTWEAIIETPAPVPDAEASWLVTDAMNPDTLAVGVITRDSNGAAISAGVVWRDGVTGTYTADTVSTDFPGAVDGYHVTYAGGAKTYTQPTMTRDASGAVIDRPQMVVS